MVRLINLNKLINGLIDYLSSLLFVRQICVYKV